STRPKQGRRGNGPIVEGRYSDGWPPSGTGSRFVSNMKVTLHHSSSENRRRLQRVLLSARERLEYAKDRITLAQMLALPRALTAIAGRERACAAGCIRLARRRSGHVVFESRSPAAPRSDGIPIPWPARC